jgi:hypothetical protein
MILQAVASVRESANERSALMQGAIANRSDYEQSKETISEEVSNAVEERSKVIITSTTLKSDIPGSRTEF